MAMGEGAFNDEEFIGVDYRDVLEDETKSFDLVLGAVGEVGDGAFGNAFAFTPAFAQEDGGAGVSVGDGVDLHGNYYRTYSSPIQHDRHYITWEYR